MTEVERLKAENAALLLALSLPQWEYYLARTTEVNNIRDQTVAEFLTKQGQFGWELCGIEYGCFIFKRRKLR